MICSRYLENKDFNPQTYYQLKVDTGKDKICFSAISKERYNSKTDAETILERLRSAESIRIVNVETKQAGQEPPLLYDLTTLQKEANSRHSFQPIKPCLLHSRFMKQSLYPIPGQAAVISLKMFLPKYLHLSKGCTTTRRLAYPQKHYWSMSSTSDPSTTRK